MSPNIDLFIGIATGMAFGFALGVFVMSLCPASEDSDKKEVQA